MSHDSEEGREPTKANPMNQSGKDKGNGRFFLGAASGAAVAILAPLFNKQLRPVVRGAIKGGIVSGRYIQKLAEGVAEDFQDITAEAKADLAKKEADAQDQKGTV